MANLDLTVLDLTRQAITCISIEPGFHLMSKDLFCHVEKIKHHSFNVSFVQASIGIAYQHC